MLEGCSSVRAPASSSGSAPTTGRFKPPGTTPVALLSVKRNPNKPRGANKSDEFCLPVLPDIPEAYTEANPEFSASMSEEKEMKSKPCTPQPAGKKKKGGNDVKSERETSVDTADKDRGALQSSGALNSKKQASRTSTKEIAVLSAGDTSIETEKRKKKHRRGKRNNDSNDAATEAMDSSMGCETTTGADSVIVIISDSSKDKTAGAPMSIEPAADAAAAVDAAANDGGGGMDEEGVSNDGAQQQQFQPASTRSPEIAVKSKRNKQAMLRSHDMDVGGGDVDAVDAAANDAGGGVDEEGVSNVQPASIRSRTSTQAIAVKSKRNKQAMLKSHDMDVGCGDVDVENLQRRLSEIDGLFRIPLEKEGDLDLARKFVAKSQAFLVQLAEHAEECGLLQGAIFQDLLARLSRSDPHATFVISNRTSRLPKRELEDILAVEAMERAQALCNLVRIKIEDDNDLKLVRKALREASQFFKDLRHYQKYQQVQLHGRSLTEMEVVAGLRTMWR